MEVAISNPPKRKEEGGGGKDQVCETVKIKFTKLRKDEENNSQKPRSQISKIVRNEIRHCFISLIINYLCGILDLHYEIPPCEKKKKSLSIGTGIKRIFLIVRFN